MSHFACWRKRLVLLSLSALAGWPLLPDAQAGSGTPNDLSGLSWSSDSTGPGRFVAVHGRRAAIFGYSDSGLESWVYPLQVFSAFRVAFRPQGGSSEIDGQSVFRRVICTAQSVTRIYVGPDFVVRERLFVPLDAPGAILSYQVEGARPVDIVVRFVPVLDLMWPAATGGQETAWNAAASAYVLSEASRRYRASVGSPDILARDDTLNTTRRAARSPALAFTIRPRAGRTARVVIAASTAAQSEDPTAIAARLLEQDDALESAAAAHYRALLDEVLQVETPDSDVNRALAWSEVALDQAWVCNPDLGCGLVAGYGPSRKARRPQYDWFFAGDGMVAIHALLASGQYARAREELEFILRYRDRKTGMIWHELSQGAASLDWVKYPYMYVHVDLSFDFLNTVDEYFATTGDLEFLRSHWEALLGAYRYCRSLLDSADGLPRIPAGKQGLNEQDALSDELRLSASWVSASQAFADLATATGHAPLAGAAHLTSQQAGRAVTRRYWDEQHHFWISGYTRAGAPVTDHDTGPTPAMNEALFSSPQRDAVLDELASADFQADWGSRSKAASASSYDPNAYASGSVWGLGTAEVASAFFGAHRPASAVPIWNALVPWSSLDSLGHMHEVLAGDYYREELESVPEQSWSSAGFLTATVRGLLGLQVAAGARRVSFTPHLPPGWSAVALKHVHVGGAELGIEVLQSAGEVGLRLQNSGAPVDMMFDPQLPLGAKPVGAQFQGRPIAVGLEQNAQDTHARMQFRVPHGSASLTLTYQGGVAILPVLTEPAVGAPSEALKIVRTTLAGGELTIEFDRAGAAAATLELRTPWKIRSLQGATYEASAASVYRLSIAAPAAPAQAHVYQRGTVTVLLAETD